jgi:hypothetical protein
VIKLGEVVMLLDLQRQGRTVSAIARQLGLDRKSQADVARPYGISQATVCRLARMMLEDRE